ncbi:MAG: 50S ribosomal protein L22 [Parcubacteria group bacterium]
MADVTAKLNRLDITPRKVRGIIRIISGLPVGEAEAQLLFRRERAVRPILKLLRSAVANAKNKGLAADTLFVKEIWADEGPVLKRWLPRARGMATPLHKKFSHVTIVLASDSSKKSRFAISEPIQKKKTKKAPKRGKTSDKTLKKEEPKPKEKKESKEKAARQPAEKKAENAVKRMFRRKAI